MVQSGMPTPVNHSLSEGQGRSRDRNAWRAELRINSMESMSVPSRSKRTAGREGTLSSGTGLWALARGSYGNTEGRRATYERGPSPNPILMAHPRRAVVAELRKLLLQMVAAVVALDVAAIGLY